jgi:hypothetical protein
MKSTNPLLSEGIRQSPFATSPSRFCKVIGFLEPAVTSDNHILIWKNQHVLYLMPGKPMPGACRRPTKTYAFVLRSAFIILQS